MTLTYFWVALGGALGSAARFWISNLAAARWGETFPWGTLLINVSGSFLIGILAGHSTATDSWFASDSARKFLMVGICGGYTTFSAFSLQTLTLAQKEQWLSAGLYILASVALCLVATWLGYLLGAAINPTRGN